MFKCVKELSSFLSASFPNGKTTDPEIVPEICPPNNEGDIAINCFRLAGAFGQKPDVIADKAVEFLSAHCDVEKVEKIKAFVNVTLKPQALFGQTAGCIDSILASEIIRESEKKKILVEYSAPNTNKPMHLGHVRNNTIGMSLVSLLERAGHTVFPINLINDRGIHICKSMVAYQRFGNGSTPESAGKKGDHFVGDFYVLFDKELKRQIAELKQKRPDFMEKSDEDLFLETEIGTATQETLRKWENGDHDTIALWKKMNGWVIAGFEQTYGRMGVRFNKTYLESETYMLGKDIILKGLQDGIFRKRDDGAIFVDLTKFKLNEKVLLRSDGTSVYMTQDIGTTIRKYEDFKADGQIWVVADEQIHHFNTLFTIMKLLGYNWAANLYHLAYGMVNLPSGKMKSREGTVVDADNLFDDMHELARSATIERCGDNVPADLEKRSEIISMGALKFMLLKYNPKTTVMFDPQASIKFEGDTGPYVQYVCARINSIRKKVLEQSTCSQGTVDDIDWTLMTSKPERGVAVLLSLYLNSVSGAAEKLDCSILVAYLLNLAKAFNTFYKDCSVLNAENIQLRNSRLALCIAVQKVLCDGLAALTIDVPEAM